jgi:hypothetical protein
MDAQVGDNQKELLFRVLDETLHEIDEVDKSRHVRRALVDLEPHGTAMAASGSLISTFRCRRKKAVEPFAAVFGRNPKGKGKIIFLTHACSARRVPALKHFGTIDGTKILTV